METEGQLPPKPFVRCFAFENVFYLDIEVTGAGEKV